MFADGTFVAAGNSQQSASINYLLTSRPASSSNEKKPGS